MGGGDVKIDRCELSILFLHLQSNPLNKTCTPKIDIVHLCLDIVKLIT